MNPEWEENYVSTGGAVLLVPQIHVTGREMVYVREGEKNGRLLKLLCCLKRHNAVSTVVSQTFVFVPDHFIPIYKYRFSLYPIIHEGVTKPATTDGFSKGEQC